MIIFAFILVGLVLVILQTTIFMIHPLWDFSPDLYYILVAYLAYRLDLFRSLIILFPLSCLLDVFSGTILGMYSVLCYSGYGLLRFASTRLPVSESLYQVPLIGVSYLAVSWVIYVMMSFFEPDTLVEWSWWKTILRTVLLVICAFPLFRIFEAMNKRLQRGILPWNKLRIKSDNRFRH
ncbi:hypothetical protein [Desulfogranum japonicum]|uniref:hypothetical protein n=1 Tax=Desulfogranum japonicum TaxID=231447 RepID=UPI0004130F26|nr:hypothetical protein [Desulfogranum japonicum]